jgi:hypothetical protein
MKEDKEAATAAEEEKKGRNNIPKIKDEFIS